MSGSFQELAYRTCQMLFDEFAGKMVRDILDGQELNSLDVNELESVRATLIQAYNLAFEVRNFFHHPKILLSYLCAMQRMTFSFSVSSRILPNITETGSSLFCLANGLLGKGLVAFRIRIC